MRVPYLVRLGAWVVPCLGLVACSSANAPSGPRIGSVAQSPGGALPTAGVGASSGRAAGGNSANDNPTNLVTPSMAAASGTGGAGGASTTIPGQKVSSARDPVSIDQCTGANLNGLSASDVQALLAGSGGASGIKWLYPYDGTVFPRGMQAPLLMWDGTADAVYVHLQGKAFEYKGCLKPTAAGQLQLAQDVWDKAGQQTYGASDPFVLELTTLSGGKATGPATEHITIAQATIKGSIYYNSYNSKLAMSSGNGLGPTGGVVLRIPPGGQAELFLSTSCVGCHSVSANGSRMVAQPIQMGMAYPLVQNGAANPTGVAAAPRSAFGALYPDGSHYLSMSGAISIARTTMTEGPNAPADATLYDAVTGQVTPSTGIPGGALMPMFSPDGTLLVFNDYAANTAHGLALMKYDTATHTATDYKVIDMEPDGSTRPGWPFVLPDNGGVVFVRTDGDDFSGDGAGIMGQGGLNFGGGPTTSTAPNSDLYLVDLKSGTATMLAKAMGYATPQDAMSGTTYLPFGAEELHHNYFPTVSPVAAGGYFWVFFDSLRHYGNLGQQRELWGTAIDIRADGSYASDLSHPAFYLPGQELGTGNHRAFAALDPCKQMGDKCSSGIDCCGGFCYFDNSAPELVDAVGSCMPPPTNQCAKLDEKCKTDADCCPPQNGDPPDTCIAGFCAYVTVN